MVLTEEQLDIEKADQQLTGFAHATKGYSLTELVTSMGLTKTEWGVLKTKYLALEYLSEEQVNEIDDYFNVNQ